MLRIHGGDEVTLAGLKRLIEDGATLTLKRYDRQTPEGWEPTTHNPRNMEVTP